MSRRTVGRLTLETALEEWPLSAPLRITGYTFTTMTLVVVTLSDGVHSGRGEAAGVFYLNESPSNLIGQIEAVRGKLEAGLTREELRVLLPPGGARNAVDCALWSSSASTARLSISTDRCF